MPTAAFSFHPHPTSSRVSFGFTMSQILRRCSSLVELPLWASFLSCRLRFAICSSSLLSTGGPWLHHQSLFSWIFFCTSLTYTRLLVSSFSMWHNIKWSHAHRSIIFIFCVECSMSCTLPLWTLSLSCELKAFNHKALPGASSSTSIRSVRHKCFPHHAAFVLLQLNSVTCLIIWVRYLHVPNHYNDRTQYFLKVLFSISSYISVQTVSIKIFTNKRISLEFTPWNDTVQLGGLRSFSMSLFADDLLCTNPTITRSLTKFAE